jgi:hypothetical protein
MSAEAKIGSEHVAGPFDVELVDEGTEVSPPTESRIESLLTTLALSTSPEHVDLSEMSELKREDILKVIHALSDNERVTSLNLANQRVDTVVLNTLTEVFLTQDTCRLRLLGLGSTSLVSADFPALQDLMSRGSSLREIDLENNTNLTLKSTNDMFGSKDGNVDLPPGVKAIFDGLDANHGISSVYFQTKANRNSSQYRSVDNRGTLPTATAVGEAVGDQLLRRLLRARETLPTDDTVPTLHLSRIPIISHLPPNLFEGRGIGNVDELRLPYYDMHGPLPLNWASLSSTLVKLDLKHNRLSGPLAPEIGGLIHLVRLDLQHNAFTGELPVEWRTLTMLSRVDLSGNQLNGSIPEEWGEMISLKHVDLSDNCLHGTIPESIGSWEDLALLDVRKNNICGTIPLSANNCKHLIELHHDNTLSVPFILDVKIRKACTYGNLVGDAKAAASYLGIACPEEPLVTIREKVLFMSAITVFLVDFITDTIAALSYIVAGRAIGWLLALSSLGASWIGLHVYSEVGEDRSWNRWQSERRDQTSASCSVSCCKICGMRFVQFLLGPLSITLLGIYEFFHGLQIGNETARWQVLRATESFVDAFPQAFFQSYGVLNEWDCMFRANISATTMIGNTTSATTELAICTPCVQKAAQTNRNLRFVSLSMTLLLLSWTCAMNFDTDGIYRFVNRRTGKNRKDSFVLVKTLQLICSFYHLVSLAFRVGTSMLFVVSVHSVVKEDGFALLICASVLLGLVICRIMFVNCLARSQTKSQAILSVLTESVFVNYLNQNLFRVLTFYTTYVEGGLFLLVIYYSKEEINACERRRNFDIPVAIATLGACAFMKTCLHFVLVEPLHKARSEEVSHLQLPQLKSSSSYRR